MQRSLGGWLLVGMALVFLALSAPARGAKTPLPTAPLREHHAELLAHLEHVWHFADSVGTGDYAQERQEAAQIAAWLGKNIKEHAESEARFIYPEVARLMGAQDATRTMLMDHTFIGRYIDEITAAVPAGGQQWDPDQLRRLRGSLYQLQGILLPHFEKENDIYLTLLDRKMTAAQVKTRIVDPISRAHTGGAHGGHHH